MIPSANPTMSRMPNPTKVISLTLDWPLTYFSHFSKVCQAVFFSKTRLSIWARS